MAATDDTNLWVKFFKKAGLPANVAVKYALTFSENRIKKDMLLDLNKEYLKEMGITLMGDIISILKHAKEVTEEDARSNVLKSGYDSPPVVAKKIAAVKLVKKVKQPPPAAAAAPLDSMKVLNAVAAKKSLIQQRSSVVAKRVIAKTVLESTAKAKPQQPVYEDLEIIEPPKKKARRVLPEHEGQYKIIMPSGTIPRTQKIIAEKAEINSVKKTVFDRLGDSSVSSTTGPLPAKLNETKITVSISGSNLGMVRTASAVSNLPDKFNPSVFARLGNKSSGTASTEVATKLATKMDPVPKLQYAGVLKKTIQSASVTPPMKRKLVKTVKKVPTLRADLPSTLVQERLGSTSMSSSTSVPRALPARLLPTPPSQRSAIRTLPVSTSKAAMGIKQRLGLSSVIQSPTFSSGKVSSVARTLVPVVSSTTSTKAASVFLRLGR